MAKSPEKEQKKPVSQSYWSLVWWKFKKNKLAILGGIIVLLFYFSMVIIPEFLSPYLLEHRTNFTQAPPTSLHFVDEAGQFHLRPFVYGQEKKVDVQTRTRSFAEDKTKIYPLQFFVRGEPYKLLGFIPSSIHLFGVS